MFAEFSFDGRAMAALERLTIGTGFSIFSQTDFAAFYENLQYFGVRLAKLKVSARTVARALRGLSAADRSLPAQALPAQRVCRKPWPRWRRSPRPAYVAVSGAYFDAQKTESEALLSVLDAELSARNLDALLQRVLEISYATCSAPRWESILLKDGAAGAASARASGLWRRP